jgi:hypothetical protein
LNWLLSVPEFATWPFARAISPTAWPAGGSWTTVICAKPLPCKAAYMSGVESWRELPDGDIEFTMRRLRSAD